MLYTLSVKFQPDLGATDSALLVRNALLESLAFASGVTVKMYDASYDTTSIAVTVSARVTSVPEAAEAAKTSFVEKVIGLVNDHRATVRLVGSEQIPVAVAALDASADPDEVENYSADDEDEPLDA